MNKILNSKTHLPIALLGFGIFGLFLGPTNSTHAEARGNQNHNIQSNNQDMSSERYTWATQGGGSNSRNASTARRSFTPQRWMSHTAFSSNAFSSTGFDNDPLSSRSQDFPNWDRELISRSHFGWDVELIGEAESEASAEAPAPPLEDPVLNSAVDREIRKEINTELELPVQP